MTKISWDNLPDRVRTYIAEDNGLHYIRRLLRRVPIEVSEIAGALEAERDDGKEIPDLVLRDLRALDVAPRQSFTIEGYRIYDRVVRAHSHSGSVPAPVSEVGKRAALVILDP